MDMHLFIEKGMRGGISMVSKRHAKANNPHVADYNPDKETNYIMYYNANNLYGWAMSQPLPYSSFKWLSGKIGKRKEGKGRIFEVDLEYPKHLHKLHNDYPLAPEKISVQEGWLSSYQTKKGKRKVQGVPQSQTAALPRPQEEEETDKSKQAQIEQTYESTKISSLFPKRGNHNTKRTEKHKNKMTHEKTYNKSPRRINHKATKSKTNTGTTALERSVE